MPTYRRITSPLTAAPRREFELEADGWSYLAAIGKIESDHGRSTAPGVHSGQNSHGCCAGPMQIHNGFGSGGGTWGAYKVDGDGDGRLDIYDADDAVATAAHYLRAAGAPGDWRAALFAYNHAGWYVDQVLEQAAEYRRAAELPHADAGRRVVAGSRMSPASPASGATRASLPDVVALSPPTGCTLTDCYGGKPHALQGEHPLGLAIDVVAVRRRLATDGALARAAGWTPACAARGCPR